MNKRLLHLTVIIAVIIVLAAISGFAQSYFRYVKLTDDIMDNYRSNGQNLSMLIENAFNNNVSLVNSFESSLYNEMIMDLNIEYGNEQFSDTVSEGFYFSDISKEDSFVIILRNNDKQVRIARTKEWFSEIENISGPGKYIQNIGKINAIKYIIIQDDLGIIIATENVDSAVNIFSDSKLMYALIENEDVFRKIEFGKEIVYEYIHPFVNNRIMRIAFDGKPVNNSIIQTKIMFFSIIGTIAVFAMLLAITIFLYIRNTSIIMKSAAEDRRRSLYLDMLSEGIVVISEGKIIMINKSALDILDAENKDKAESEIVKNDIFGLNNGDTISMEKKQIKYGKLDILYSVSMDISQFTIITFTDITEYNILKRENEIKEKQAMLGELSFRVAHELKNPLNGMYIILQRIMEEANNENEQMLKDAMQEIERMNRRIVDFTRFAKPNNYEFSEMEVSGIINDVLSSLSAQISNKNISVETDMDSCLTKGDHEYMYIALKNIILNAIEAVKESGRISIRGTCAGDYYIYIKDDGIGMDKHNLERIFELYYTTKETGSGIGLANAYRIIKDHGGSIGVESERDKGTLVTIILKSGETGGKNSVD